MGGFDGSVDLVDAASTLLPARRCRLRRTRSAIARRLGPLGTTPQPLRWHSSCRPPVRPGPHQAFRSNSPFRGRLAAVI